MNKDNDYIDGFEDGVLLIKNILSLSVEERLRRFRSADIAVILDKFDFQQLKELYNTPADKELKVYYVIRGIQTNGLLKRVTVESERYEYFPSPNTIEQFIRTNNLQTKLVDFATVEHIYVYE